MKLVIPLAFMFLTVRANPRNKLVDLSYTFDESTIGWLTDKPFQMRIIQNGTTPYGYWLQTEEYSSGTHVGTHMDAPCVTSKGRWTLDQIPLEGFVAPAAVVDITHRVNRDRDALLLIEDLQEWELLTGVTLDETILLVRTGWGSRWPDREAYIGNANNDMNELHFPGVSPETAKWLVHNRRIYGLGIESMSLQNGLTESRRILPTHEILHSANIYSLANVANLQHLPLYGAMLYVAPMKIGDACAGPVRIIAQLPRAAFNMPRAQA